MFQKKVINLMVKMNFNRLSLTVNCASAMSVVQLRRSVTKKQQIASVKRMLLDQLATFAHRALLIYKNLTQEAVANASVSAKQLLVLHRNFSAHIL